MSLRAFQILVLRTRKNNTVFSFWESGLCVTGRLCLMVLKSKWLGIAFWGLCMHWFQLLVVFRPSLLMDKPDPSIRKNSIWINIG
ncbi:hypothetical protein RCL_jg7392.t1 [Rhizophagus clarus]|uniref:Uncharacterized protein n=1 Tax=Rhizophagus clarus TaxID=94130 RepID=A0A8H3QI81_9GLOM|nr:hypothetical protein RCL_jg7392.t1 [Rhizophagus clarus]